MRYYKNYDPYWLTAKFGNCKECKESLKGKRAFFYPLTKDVFCEKCGEKHSGEFNNSVFDESVYNRDF